MANAVIRLLLILGCLQAAACSLLPLPSEPPQQREGPPLRLLSSAASPPLVDDFDRPSLIAAATHQLAYLLRQDPDTVVSFGQERYQMRRLTVSVQKLLDKLRQDPSPKQLRRFLADNYLLYQAAGRQGRSFGEMLVTGYYEPIFAGSLMSTSTFTVPIYAPPSNLVPLDVSNSSRGMARRNSQGTLVPYWTRAEIDNSPSLLQGSELAYLSDPFEAFLLHVQGSGRIRLPDRSIRSVRFAASNGHGYESIGKLLVDQGKLSLEQATIPGIQDYLRRHPDEVRRILHHNPRYIFFNWGDNNGPRGSSGEILTPGRSVALDRDVLPIGPFGLVISRLPGGGDNTTSATPLALTRIVFPQDTGAAIKGPGRIDIFFGNDDQAEYIAHRLNEPGKLYFFLWKHADQ